MSVYSTVIDIWALQSQPNFQPRATLPSNHSPGSSRVPSNEIRTPILNGGDGDAHNDNQIRQEAAAGTVSSRPSSSNIGQKNLAPVPNNWGEVVISPRRKKEIRRLVLLMVLKEGIFSVFWGLINPSHLHSLHPFTTLSHCLSFLDCYTPFFLSIFVSPSCYFSVYPKNQDITVQYTYVEMSHLLILRIILDHSSSQWFTTMG